MLLQRRFSVAAVKLLFSELLASPDVCPRMGLLRPSWRLKTPDKRPLGQLEKRTMGSAFICISLMMCQVQPFSYVNRLFVFLAMKLKPSSLESCVTCGYCLVPLLAPLGWCVGHRQDRRGRVRGSEGSAPHGACGHLCGAGNLCT